MGIPLEAGMPPDTELNNGCTVIFDAIDPTDGSQVSGVLFIDGVLYVDVTQGDIADLAAGPFMLVPGPGA